MIIQIADKAECQCKRLKCLRHGNCAACREHHLEKGTLAVCDRQKAKEEKSAKKALEQLKEKKDPE